MLEGSAERCWAVAGGVAVGVSSGTRASVRTRSVLLRFEFGWWMTESMCRCFFLGDLAGGAFFLSFCLLVSFTVVAGAVVAPAGDLVDVSLSASMVAASAGALVEESLSMIIFFSSAAAVVASAGVPGAPPGASVELTLSPVSVACALT